MSKDGEGVYAILWHDGFHAPGTSLQTTVTVKEIVRTQELAEAEVRRLNALNEGSGSGYWWQYTRLFPDGQSAGSRSQ
jgi:hypothetical protein